MITAHRIERLLDAGFHDRLLTEVLQNGRELPLAARLRLSAPEALVPAAAGLALQRLSELTHRPGRTAREHALALVGMQDASGGFGSPAATAAAVAGLLAVIGQCAARPGVATPEFVQRLDRAVDLGLHALFQTQRAGGDEECPGLLGDAMDSALGLWLLGEAPRFREAVRVRDLVAAIRTGGGADDPQVGAVLALAMAGVGERVRIAA